MHAIVCAFLTHVCAQKQKKSGSKLKFKPRDDDSSGEEDIFSGSQNASTSVDLTAMSSEEENRAPPKKKKKTDKPKTGQLKKKSAASHLSHAAPSYREVDSEEERIEAEMQMEEDSDSSSSENPEYNAAANQAASVLSNVTKLSKTIMNKVKVWGGAKAMAAADDDENDDGAIGLTEGGSATDSTWITEDIMRPLLAPTCKLSQYQLVGVNWLAMLSRLKFGKDNVNGILGDEMGLGKTVQVSKLFNSLLLTHCADQHTPNIIAEQSTLPPCSHRLICYGADVWGGAAPLFTMCIAHLLKDLGQRCVCGPIKTRCLLFTHVYGPLA